jgi:hypothetical protein
MMAIDWQEFDYFVSFLIRILLIFIFSYLTCMQSDKDGCEKYDGITHLVEHPIQMKPPSMQSFD